MTRKDSLPYLLSKSGLSALREFVDCTTLFAFDLDGTLAPIVANPGDIEVPEAIRSELARLKNLATVAIITGRSRSDALNHLGMETQYIIGNHGAEGLPGWEYQEAAFRSLGLEWERQLNKWIPDMNKSGFFFENKGPSLSIHYRGVRNKRGARSSLLEAIHSLIPRPRHVSGKFVENLLPEAAPDKGSAVIQLMRYTGLVKGLFVGDDETDEDVFRLSGDHLLTVRVGNKIGSKASYLLKNQQEIPVLLQIINLTLGKLKCT